MNSTVPQRKEFLKSSENQKSRRSGRALIAVLCFAACMYDVTTFFLMFAKYDTVCEITLKVAMSSTLPGFAVCNRNRAFKSLSCQEFPGGCEATSFSKVLSDIYHFRTSKFAYAARRETLFVDCKAKTEDGDEISILEYCHKSTAVYDGYDVCFVVNVPEEEKIFTSVELILNSEPHEILWPEMLIANLKVYVLGRKELPSAIFQAGSVEAMSSAVFRLRKTTILGLPYPYKTNCEHYGENENDAVSFTDCHTRCVNRDTLDYIGCFPRYNVHLIKDENSSCSEMTFNAYSNLQSVVNDHVDQAFQEAVNNRLARADLMCLKRCKQSCVSEYYDIQIDQDEIPIENEETKLHENFSTVARNKRDDRSTLSKDSAD